VGTRFAQGAAGAVAVLGVVLASLCVYGLRGAGATLGEMLDSYGLTNLVIGVSLAATGTVLALARPRVAIGWLFQAAGVCYLLSAAALALLPLPGRQGPVVAEVPASVAGALYYASWPVAIGVLIPLGLLAFPEGRLRGRLNLALATLICVTGTGFWVAYGLFPGEGGLRNGIGVPAGTYATLQPLWAAANLGNLAAWLAVCGVLVARYLRGDETVKRRMLWVVLALLATVAITVPFGVFGIGEVGLLAAFVLVPSGVMIGVLRHRLLDIRLALSRTLVWVLLAGVVLGADLLLVTLLSPLITPPGWSTAIAALLVALSAEPLRRLLHRGIDRLVFGRHGPAAVTRLLRARLADAEDPAALIEGLRRALGVAGLRYEVTRIGMVAQSGRVDETAERVELVVGTETVGVLLVGARRGDAGLRHADRALLAVVEPALGVLARSLRLAAALGESRSRIVEAAEVERRRLQRDLHDSVASAVTGVQFKLDAARASHPEAERTRHVLDDASSDLRQVLASLRLVIDDLRPPELDRLGLAAALRIRWTRAVGRSGATVDIRVDAEPPATPPGALPAATEAAAYRIAVEATTNALRHSAARTIRIRLHAGNDALTVRVSDDGGASPGWREGTGMRSMRERAEHLGGSLDIGLDGAGMTVEARLPFPPAEESPPTGEWHADDGRPPDDRLPADAEHAHA
jgi:signal transduction histidine kinase